LRVVWKRCSRSETTLSLGVARHQLIIEGVATDDGNPVLARIFAPATCIGTNLGAPEVSCAGIDCEGNCIGSRHRCGRQWGVAIGPIGMEPPGFSHAVGTTSDSCQ